MYLNDTQIEESVRAIKQYIYKSSAVKRGRKRDLAKSDNEERIFIDVLFKNIPANTRTFIHNVYLPKHWTLELDPEDCNIALFVKHKKPATEAEELQFKRDRDLDISNTHDYYRDLFNEKLSVENQKRITKLITSKELATKYNTFKQLDSLSKSHDLFLADKPLMENKLNPLPRRLGKRFWVRQKKVPLMIRLKADNLEERLNHALRTQPFYVTGRSANEQLQVGILSQSDNDLVSNIKAFLEKLENVYGDCVRMLRIRSDLGIPLPIFADLSALCPKVVMRSKKKRNRPVPQEFDLLPDDKRVLVKSDGSVDVVQARPKKIKKVKTKSDANLSVMSGYSITKKF